MPEDLDDVLVVSRHGGTVHRWDCDLAPCGGCGATRWTPATTGLDDRPCGVCLPEGLPA